MPLVPLKLEQWEVNLLKGLPISLMDIRPPSKTKVKVWETVLSSWEDEVDDTFLMMAYHLHQSLTLGTSETIDQDDTLLLLIAVKLVKAFVQLNSTGPKIDKGKICETTKAVYNEGIDVRELEVDGLEVCQHAVLPQLLVIAQELLKRSSSNVDLWVGKLYGWWGIRTWFLHQRILDGRSVRLAGCIGAAAGAIQSQFEGYEEDMDLKTLWLCEQADVYLYYYDVANARKSLGEAGECCGAQFSTTGMLGKRTRYQQKDLAQLVVQANIKESQEKEENLVYFEEFKKYRSLVNVPLDDDTRLETIKLKEDQSNVDCSLTTIQQILLLAELNYMKKSQAKDELLKEEMLAYLRRLLNDPKLWNVYVVSLLMRSGVETDHFRTVERSMMQFENLQKAVHIDVSPSFNVRYQFYHAACMPLTWEIDVAFADVLVSLGHTKNALDVYLKLDMWEEVIACYSLLELRHKAEEVIREQIARRGETPKLLVYLGDATDDTSLYDKAWELSEHRSFLSRQRLGLFWFKKREYVQAIPFLQQAVQLNPLEYPVWIRLAYASLESENWALAVKAYVHANNLNDESFENWNNLAKAALKLGNKEQALRALKQATKCDYEQWKVWENLMVVALQCCDLEWTIIAFNRIIDLKGAYTDEAVLRLLVELTCDDKWDQKGDASMRTKDALQKLFGRITAKVTSNAEVWQCYSTFLYCNLESKSKAMTSMEDRWYNVIQYQQKAVRCRIQNQTWDKIPDATKSTVSSVVMLCERTRELEERLPTHPSAKDLMVQAEFLHKQVANSIDRKLKDFPDSSLYQECAGTLASALQTLKRCN